MSLYDVTEEVISKTKNYHPKQHLFFVFPSYSKVAIAVGAYIAMHEAADHAKAINGCKRLGRLVNGQAECM